MDKNEIQEEGLPEPVKHKHTRITAKVYGLESGKSLEQLIKENPGSKLVFPERKK